MNKFSFAGRVAIVTGAGGGLGRSHAIQLAARGAKVVVNDIGSNCVDSDADSAAQRVVNEIREAGGDAIASTASVVDQQQVANMIALTLDTWGQIDILVNNAGILRDKSFAKMQLDDWRSVVDVHLNGTAYCTHAVWPVMRQQGYGRIVMTTSTSGLYGNFGQANYGAAKMGLIGLMNVLSLEARKYNIRINCLAPTAATRMTENLFPAEVLEVLAPEYVSPAVLFLASDGAPERKILMAGAGCYTVARIIEGPGVYLSESECTPEDIAARFSEIDNSDGGLELLEGNEHIEKIVKLSRSGVR